MAKSKKGLTRDEQLQVLQDEVNTALGVNGKVFLGKDLEPLERIPTGLLAFDTITGGGLVRKHYIELFGEESAGKTLLALRCVAAVQKKGGVAAWVIGEEWTGDEWAEQQGVDVNKLIKIEALTGDLMLETAVTYLESGLVDLLVLDSIQAIGTVRESESGVDQEAYAGGGAPQLWGRFYRRTRGLFNGRKSKAAIIGISQVRAAIGGFSPSGKPEPKPTQIHVIKHWKAISVLCKRGEPVFADLKNEKRKIISRDFKLRCVKNKCFPPERVSSFRYNFRGPDKGVDQVEEVMRLAKVYGLIEQRGKKLEGYGISVIGSKDSPAEAAYVEKLKKKPTTMRELRTDILAAALED